MKKPRVFISYTHADSRFVYPFADKLEACGIDVWIDKSKIKVGDSIIQKINEGIGASDWLIVVLSRASVESKWVREELNAALINNVEQEKRAFILPVLIEECNIPSLLRHRKYADFKDDPEQAFQGLLEVIQPVKPVKSVNFEIPEQALNLEIGERRILASPVVEKIVGLGRGVLPFLLLVLVGTTVFLIAKFGNNGVIRAILDGEPPSTPAVSICGGGFIGLVYGGVIIYVLWQMTEVRRRITHINRTFDQFPGSAYPNLTASHIIRTSRNARFTYTVLFLFLVVFSVSYPIGVYLLLS